MTHDHGGVLAEQQVIQRLPDQSAPVDDHRQRRRCPDLIPVKQLHHPLRGARYEVRASVEELTCVGGGESVDVFLWVDLLDHLPFVKVTAEWELQEDGADSAVGVEPFDEAGGLFGWG